LGALILASKVWEYLGVWNIDYLYSFPNISLQDLNRLEQEYLICLKFTVTLNVSVYAKYYFQLRALSDRTEQNFPLKPLDHAGAEILEAKSRGVEEAAKMKNRGSHRALSLDAYQHNSPVTLEQLQNKFGKKMAKRGGKWIKENKRKNRKKIKEKSRENCILILNHPHLLDPWHARKSDVVLGNNNV